MANGNLSRKDIIVNNFLGGLAWGIGTVIGATVVVAVIGATLSSLGFFDIFKQLPQVPQPYTK